MKLEYIEGYYPNSKYLGVTTLSTYGLEPEVGMPNTWVKEKGNNCKTLIFKDKHTYHAIIVPSRGHSLEFFQGKHIGVSNKPKE